MLTKTEVRTYSSTEARDRFSDIFNDAFYGHPVIVNNRRRSVAVVSIELLRAILETEGDEDAKRAKVALEEFFRQGGKSMEKLREELGVK